MLVVDPCRLESSQSRIEELASPGKHMLLTVLLMQTERRLVALSLYTSGASGYTAIVFGRSWLMQHT